MKCSDCPRCRTEKCVELASIEAALVLINSAFLLPSPISANRHLMHVSLQRKLWTSIILALILQLVMGIQIFRVPRCKDSVRNLDATVTSTVALCLIRFVGIWRLWEARLGIDHIHDFMPIDDWPRSPLLPCSCWKCILICHHRRVRRWGQWWYYSSPQCRYLRRWIASLVPELNTR